MNWFKIAFISRSDIETYIHVYTNFLKHKLPVFMVDWLTLVVVAFLEKVWMIFSDSMILLGSVKKFELERILWVHLSQEQKVVVPEDDGDIASTPGSSRAPTPPPMVEVIPDRPKPRFMVSKVDETVKPGKRVEQKPSVFSIAKSVSCFIYLYIFCCLKQADIFDTLFV